MLNSGSTHSRPEPRVIGVDPGKLTGLALLHGDSLTRVVAPVPEVEDILRVWLASEVVTDVAIERFVITRNTARKTQQLDAIKVSGIVENLVMHVDHHRVVYQNMSDAKRFGNPQLMRALGWWETGRHSSHKNDATSQVLKLLADRYPDWVHLHVTPDII
jgi:hypothetical protein